MAIDLTSVGDFAWDVLIRTDTELQHGGDTFGDVLLLPGGSAANVAVWAARCCFDGIKYYVRKGICQWVRNPLKPWQTSTQLNALAAG